MGFPAIDRRRRGIALTRFGEVFLRYAGASVTALRQGVDSIAQARARDGRDDFGRRIADGRRPDADIGDPGGE